MKTAVRRPARRRSQTKLGKRNSRRPKSYVTAPVRRAKFKLRLPSLGAQRNVAAFAVSCMIVVLLAMLVLPDYGIKQIVVKGNQGTAAQDVEDAVGFVRGRNAFLLRTADISAIVAKLPGVLKAQARISLAGQAGDQRPRYTS